MSDPASIGNGWSRRRAAVRAEAEAELQAESEVIIAQKRATLEDMSDEDALAELELPDPDQMESGADFSAFMKSAVPDRLRRRALRKLWLTNPVLANVDNLVDYGEDFSISTELVEAVQTIYQVGKGMLRDEPQETLSDAPVTNDDGALENVADLDDSKDDERVVESDALEGSDDTINAKANVDRLEDGLVQEVGARSDVPVGSEQQEIEPDHGSFIKRRLKFEFDG